MKPIYICPNPVPNNDICPTCNHLNLHSHLESCDQQCSLNSAICKTKNDIRKEKLIKILKTR